jgi:ATP-dependent DNA helicase PIF1
MSTLTKRKATKSSSSEPTPKKPRQTLDNFFSPRVPLPRQSLGNDPNGPAEPSHVALNAEQTRVVKMVVDEGRNVFFTGAAGASCFDSLQLAAMGVCVIHMY